jgi:hypothetical protein
LLVAAAAISDGSERVLKGSFYFAPFAPFGGHFSRE